MSSLYSKTEACTHASMCPEQQRWARALSAFICDDCMTALPSFLLLVLLLLQVQKAFEYVLKSEEVDSPDVRYDITSRRSDSAVSQRGILMRDPLESLKAVTYVCDVHPKLHEVS